MKNIDAAFHTVRAQVGLYEDWEQPGLACETSIRTNERDEQGMKTNADANELAGALQVPREHPQRGRAPCKLLFNFVPFP